MEKVEKVVYIGVFLSAEERARLLDFVPPRHGDVHADHLTIAFRPTDEQAAEIFKATPLGTKVNLLVVGEVWDERCQAVTVRGVASANAHPHVTISTAQGTKPVYSNEMLARYQRDIYAPIHREEKHLLLTGTVGTFPSSIGGAR